MFKFRSLVSQLCGIFPYVVLQFANGSFIGYVVILIGELHRKDSEISTSLDQLSWFASFEIIQPVGTVITGLLMHRLGTRSVAFTASLMFICSLLLYHYSSTVTMMFVGRLLSSMLAIKPLCNPHISEISEPQFRGSFLAISELSFTTGSFFSLLLGSLMYWRTIALVNFTFPVIAAVTMFATPDSPTWLTNRGRLNHAEKSLCWLRGWTKSEKIQTEFCALREGIEKSRTTSNDHQQNFMQLFLQRSFYIPLCTMCLIFFGYVLSGANTIETYATVIIRELKSPIEESLATAIMGATRVIGNIMILLLVRRTGKRKLVFFSVIVIGLCYATIAIVKFSNLQNEYRWIPTVALITAKFANASGIGAIVFMLPAEIFPSSVRYIGTSLSISAKIFVDALSKKLFLYIVEALTLSGVFVLFAFLNLIAFFIYYLLLPETEGKSLREIEDRYNGVENRNECQQKY